MPLFRLFDFIGNRLCALSCCDKNIDQKQLGEERVCPATLITKGSQGRSLEAGTEAETTEEHGLLACCPCFLSLLFYITLDHLHRVAPPIVGWVSPHQSLTKKYSTDLPTGHSEGTTSPAEACLSQMTPVCVK